MKKSVVRMFFLIVVIIVEISWATELQCQVETNSSSIYLGDDQPGIGNDEAIISFDGLNLHLINLSANRVFGFPIDKGKNIYDAYSHLFRVDNIEVMEVVDSGLNIKEKKVTRTQTGESDLLAFAYGNISGDATSGQVIDGTSNFTVSALEEVFEGGKIEVAFDPELVAVKNLIFTVTSKTVGHNVSISSSNPTNCLIIYVQNYLGRSNGAEALPESVNLNFLAYKVK